MSGQDQRETWPGSQIPPVGGLLFQRAVDFLRRRWRPVERRGLLVGGHGIPELKSGHCTSGQCASGQLSLTGFLGLDGRVPWLPIRTVRVHATDTAPV